MATSKNQKAIGIVIVVTICAAVAYVVYRKFPRQRVSNGTPASGGGGIGGGSGYSDGYYPQQQDNGLAGLLSALASLFKGKSGSASPLGGGGGGGGRSAGSNVNAYNVLYDAQHGLNQDGTPINYGGLETTDTLAQSINAQIPLEGLDTLDNLPSQGVNPITGPAATNNDTLATSIDPTIALEPTNTGSAADAFNQWWDSFAGNPVNQPDTLPSQSINSSDASSYFAGPDYTTGDPNYYVDSNGDNLGSYGGDFSGGDYFGSGSDAGSNYDNSFAFAGDNSGGSYDPNSDGGSYQGDPNFDPYGGGFDNFG